MQGFAVKYYLCHNQSVEISRTNHRHRPCRMNAITGTFATQFLSKTDGGGYIAACMVQQHEVTLQVEIRL